MKALVNALSLALILDGKPPAEAKAFAEAFVEDNAELFAAPAPVARPATPAQVQRAIAGPDDVAVVHRVPVQGADGLTDVQRSAVDSGVGLCANCQQPRNRHLPGCAVATGENPRAVTKNPLPPVQ